MARTLSVSLRYITASVSLILLSACTSIKIYDDNTVSVERYFGFPIINVTPNTGAIALVETKGLGFISTPTGTTLGWVSEQLASVPIDAKCHVVLWLEDPEQLELLLSLLQRHQQSLDNICIASHGGTQNDN